MSNGSGGNSTSSPQSSSANAPVNTPSAPTTNTQMPNQAGVDAPASSSGPNTNKENSLNSQDVFDAINEGASSIQPSYDDSEVYRAEPNLTYEEKQQLQDQRNIQNNANTLRNAADIAIATKNPYAVAAGAIVKAADKLTDGKSSEMVGAIMNEGMKTAPLGGVAQDAINKISESGVGDAAGNIAGIVGSKGASSAETAGKAADTAQKAEQAQKAAENAEKAKKVAETANEIADKIPEKQHVEEETSSEENNKKSSGGGLLGLGLFASPFGIFMIFGGGFLFLIFFLLLFTLVGDEEISQSYTSVCEPFAIDSTSLSKNEFVSIMQNRYASSSHPDFATYAESIYDIGLGNGVNPELVSIRAELEGFSPGKSYNNYWGMGTYNTTGGGIRYGSFESGVMGYVENVAQYDTLYNWMYRYAYIGKYWYSVSKTSSGATNWGLGGCVFLEHIKEYMTESRYNEVKGYCNNPSYNCTSAGGGGCFKTTDEDQDAYTKFQVAKLTEMRKTIFNLDGDNCTSYGANCMIYKQGDSNWKNKRLGSSSETMGRSGCAVTSVAIGISCSGTDLLVENFDAGVFVDHLSSNGCFTSTGGIYWNCNGIRSIAPNVRVVASQSGIGSLSNYDKASTIANYAATEGNFVVIHFVNSAHPRGHYVVFTEVSGDYFKSMDPASGTITSQLISEVDQYIVYSTKGASNETE